MPKKIVDYSICHY